MAAVFPGRRRTSLPGRRLSATSLGKGPLIINPLGGVVSSSNGPTTNGTTNGHSEVDHSLSNGHLKGIGSPNNNGAPVLVGILDDLIINRGQKIEYMLKVTGAKPMTVNWYRNDTTKLKSNSNMKVTYSSSQGETKMMVMEADEEDDGEYKVEAVNQFGKAVMTCYVEVVMPTVVAGTVKQKAKQDEDEEALPELKKIQKRGSIQSLSIAEVVLTSLKINERRRSLRQSAQMIQIAMPTTIPPSKPGQPEIVDIDFDRVEIRWTPSEDQENPTDSYEIQKRLKGEDWDPTDTVSGDETSCVVLGLIERMFYDFRVVAENSGGQGEPSDPTPVVFTKAKKVVPKIDQGTYKTKVTIKRGEGFGFTLEFVGEPTPTTMWTKDNASLVTGERFKIIDGDHISKIIYQNAERKDTGTLKFEAGNEHGSDSAEISLLVLAPPSPPRGPLEVLDIQKDSITISWNSPEDDGGKPLNGYVIDKSDMKTGQWERLPHSISSDLTQFRITHLKEGREYKFHVRAENHEGLSEPLESDGAIKVTNAFDVTTPPGKPKLVNSSRKFIKIKWEKQKEGIFKPLTETGYNVYRKDLRTGTEKLVNVEPLMALEFVDETVTATKEYVYHITAINDSLESVPSEKSDVIKALPLEEAPKVDLSKLPTGKEVRIKAGDQLKLEVPFSGSPAPVVTWQRENKTLLQSDRIRHEATDSMATFYIMSALRSDTGSFAIMAQNEYGQDSGTFTIIVLDKPLAPSDLTVQDIFADRCTLTWKPPADDGGANISGYVIERLQEAEGYWLTLPDAATGTTHTVKGLTKGLKYKFRVRAENLYGLSDPVETAKAILATNPYDKCDAPGKPEVVDSDKDHITISWTPPNNDGGSPISGYNVKRKDPKSDRWTVLNYELIKEARFTDTKVFAGKDYEYRVTAVNAGGESEPSEVSDPIKAKPLKAAPEIDRSALDAVDSRVRAGNPLKIEIPVSGTPSPSVTWTKEGKDLDSARVQQLTADNMAQLLIKFCKRSDTGVYTMTATNKFGNDSAFVTIFVLDKPSAPENLQVTDTDADNCRITWQPPRDNGGAEILGYIVERCDEDGTFWKKVPGTVSGASHVVRELVPGKKYNFRIRAENIYGIGDPVETDSAVLITNQTTPQLEPETREQLVDKGETLRLKISFHGSGPFTFKLKNGTCDLSNNDANDRICLIPFEDHVLLQIKDAVKDDTGRYRIEVINSAGVGSCYVPVKVKATPGKCSGLSVTDITRIGCRLRWRPPIDDGGLRVTHYVIEKQLLSKPFWTTVASIVKDVSFDVQGLVENKEFLFRVAAANANGTGDWLETPTAITAKLSFDVPDAPGEPKSQEVGSDFVSLSWSKPRSDGGGRILGYFIEKKDATTLDSWIPVNQSLCPATIFNVPSLTEGKEYDFRVFAVNEAGRSQPAVTGQRILIKDPKDNQPDKAPNFPFPLRDRFIQEGQNFKLIASVEGQPRPTCSWYKDSSLVTHGGRYIIAYVQGVCTLEISSCKASDAGRYTCKARNALGSTETICRVDINAKISYR